MKSLIYTANCLFIILTFSISAFSQKYKASELWDAKGDIKEIKYKSKDPLLIGKKMKFDKNGKLKDSWILYNSNGIPEGIDMNFGVLNISAKFTFEQEKLILVNFDKQKPSPLSFTLKYFYSDDKITEENAEVESQEKKSSLRYLFDNYGYDEKGNWISRNVTLVISNPDGTIKSNKSYNETRTIKYY